MLKAKKVYVFAQIKNLKTNKIRSVMQLVLVNGFEPLTKQIEINRNERVISASIAN